MRRFAKPKTHLPDSHRPIFTCFVCIRHCSVAVTYLHLRPIVQQKFSRFFLPSAAEFELQDSADAFVGPLPDSASHASRTAMRDGTAFAEPSIPSRRK